MPRLILTLCCLGGLLAGPASAVVATHDSTHASVPQATAAPSAPEAAPGEHAASGGHGEAGGGHGAEGPLSVGDRVKEVMQHHLTDSAHLQLPFIPEIDLSGLRIPLPFLDGFFQATRQGTPLINWMSKAEDGHAYLMITKHLVFMGVAFVLLLILLIAARRTAGSAAPRGAGNLVEAFIVFIRDEVVLPNTGEEGRPYLPFFLTVFFFILTMNLLGLVPFGSSATGNLSVTAGLALCAFGMMQVAGIRSHGLGGHLKGLMPHGVPLFVAPILLPIEFLGMFTKPFALCVRLFANMMAGHAVIAAFTALIVVPWLALTNIPVAVAIGLLELFVAFLQAFIFTMLTAIFSGAFIHQH